MYDLIIIGGGHSGVEAANIANKLGLNVAVVLFKEKYMSSLSCNVGIGGSARGTALREMYVLGSLMPLAADENQTQTKVINSSKGPASKAFRAQVDKLGYPKYVQSKIRESNIDVIEDEVIKLIIDGKKVTGVVGKKSGNIRGKSVIISTGTFLDSEIYIGKNVFSGGPNGQKNNRSLSIQLKNLGFDLIKLKTGTSPRIYTNSINFESLKIEKGSDLPIFFTNKDLVKKRFQNTPAWITYTNDKTHKIISENVNESTLYSSDEELNGPKYCPSIEDKVKRFSEKKSHPIFLEIESDNSPTTYLSGLSTSMPQEIQKKIVNSINGLEKAIIEKPGYSIKYFSINPGQLKQTLESKLIDNLYFSGQINCTSGYVEAAIQGLIAGINVWCKLKNKEDFIVERNEGYIGVLIDDITTKKIIDPYILLTSRSEYRLLLRSDNAEKRMYEKAYKFDLISKEKYLHYKDKFKKHEKYISKLKKIKLNVKTKKFDSFLIKNGIEFQRKRGEYFSVFNILKIPNLNLLELIKLFPQKLIIFEDFNENDYTTIDISIKFKNFIKKQEGEIEKYLRYQNLIIPESTNYEEVLNMSNEAKAKLGEFKPRTVHQASRIGGINQSDIINLIYYLNKNNVSLEKSIIEE